MLVLKNICHFVPLLLFQSFKEKALMSMVNLGPTVVGSSSHSCPSASPQLSPGEPTTVGPRFASDKPIKAKA
jgi:hypothetical protein